MKIIGASDEVNSFIDSWLDPDTDTIEAHTSGSTGAPKTILLPKEDMRHSARATNKRFGIDGHSRLLLPLSPAYIAGKMMIVRAIEADCALYVEKASLSPLEAYPGTDFDLVSVVPAQIPYLIEHSVLASHIGNLIIGGGAISPAAEQALIRAGFRAFATYGMTETCSHVALRPLGQTEYQAMPGVSFSTDSESCLVIHSEDYSWRRLDTNDVVDLTNATSFVWRGRRDFVINSGGIKMYPEEIERKIAACTQAVFYITSVPDDRWGDSVTLVYEEGTADRTELETLCRQVLTRYEIPKHYVARKKIPRTASGKILRERISRIC